MGLYNRILVAVDGSDASLNALSESIKLSYWVRGSLCAICVAPPYEGDLSLTGVKNLEALLSNPCEITLTKIKDTVEKNNASIEAICVEGEPFKKIIEYAEKEGFDLIVTGIEKKSALRRALVKGVTGKIVYFGSKDVLVVPENTSIGWDKIVISDSNLQGRRVAVEKAIEITKAYGGELLFLSVSDGNIKKKMIKTEEIINDKKKLSFGIANKTITKTGNETEAFRDTALEHKANLIIMDSSVKKSIRNLFFKSTVEKVAYSCSCPVLVIHDSTLK